MVKITRTISRWGRSQMGPENVVSVASWGYEATAPVAQQSRKSVPAAVGAQGLLERRKVQETGCMAEGRLPVKLTGGFPA